MAVPFWMPAVWIGATLALAPRAPWLTLLGYHALCLLGSRGRPFRLGRVPAAAWAVVGAALLALPWILGRAHGAPALPTAGAQAFLADWPGGFGSYVGYTLTVNSVCEEWYWRGALPLDRPGWADWQHGAAFGLHHLVANALVFGAAAVVPAFLYTAFAGWAGMKVARRCGGVGLTMLAHSALNALSFAWLWTQLR